MIVWPWASNFIEWLQDRCDETGVPFKSIPTDGDYWKIVVNQQPFEFDWKHLSDSEIEAVSREALAPAGFQIRILQQSFPDFEVYFEPLVQQLSNGRLVRAATEKEFREKVYANNPHCSTADNTAGWTCSHIVDNVQKKNKKNSFFVKKEILGLFEDDIEHIYK